MTEADQKLYDALRSALQWISRTMEELPGSSQQRHSAPVHSLKQAMEALKPSPKLVGRNMGNAGKYNSPKMKEVEA